MATSGSRNFALDVSDVIEEAYELIGLEMRTGYDARKARRSLNVMFQDWMNRGVNLWTVNEVNLILTSGTSFYALNPYDVDLLEVAIRRNGIDYTMDRITREDYLNIPNKAQTGRPTQIYLERGTVGTAAGNKLTVHLWPVPDNSTDILVSYRVQSIQDADALTDDVDVPTRFIPCMVSGLAYYLALKNAPDRAQMAKQIYEEDFARAANEDSEWGSLYIRPDNRSYGW
jgi:hypothetical protein